MIRAMIAMTTTTAAMTPTTRKVLSGAWPLTTPLWPLTTPRYCFRFYSQTAELGILGGKPIK